MEHFAAIRTDGSSLSRWTNRSSDGSRSHAHAQCPRTRRFSRCGLSQSRVRDAFGPASTPRHCGQMTLSRSSTTRVPMTETMIEPIHPSPLETKTNTPPRYPVPANHYAGPSSSMPQVTRQAASLSQWTVMKEGLLGGTLSVSPRSELEEPVFMLH